MKVNSFKDLLVWQKSMLLVREIYKISGHLPKSEQFSLSDQMKRAAISIPSNIAEGFRRRSKADYLQFLNIANGSAAELETQILITRDVYKSVAPEKAEQLVIEVQKMLYVLINKLKLSKF